MKTTQEWYNLINKGQLYGITMEGIKAIQTDIINELAKVSQNYVNNSAIITPYGIKQVMLAQINRL